MDLSLPGSSVNAILQARILEWVAMAFSKLYASQPVDLMRIYTELSITFSSHDIMV